MHFQIIITETIYKFNTTYREKKKKKKNSNSDRIAYAHPVAVASTEIQAMKIFAM